MTAESLQPCDLVMKGGITSGVVYPPAIYEISKHYRLRRIGGTSAGAIAATGAAAAEFARESGGFSRLETMKNYLMGDDNLRNLFQPSPATKPLMNLVDALFPPSNPSKSQQSTFQALFRITRRLTCIWAKYLPPPSWSVFWSTLIGIVLFALLPLVVFGVISLFTPEPQYLLIIKLASLLVFGGVGGWVGLQVGGVIGAIIRLPDNFFGICTGHDDTPPNDTPPDVLTDWLSDVIDQVAGPKADKPLTFSNLRNKPPQNGQDANITLRMVTSNLSQSQPYLLPTGLKNFLFKEDDMHKLFPRDIVRHMVDFATQSSIILNDKLPQGYHFLPDEDHLPVVVAMRMSLSFPILLSAVPLYTIRVSAIKGPNEGTQRQLQECDMQRNWFSDGGICNNFPIEFFDVWLPRWPTFGINLASMPEKAFANGNQQIAPSELNKTYFSALDPKNPYKIASDAAVFLPEADDPQNPEWKDLQISPSSLQRIWAFVSAIISTGVFYRETIQANLPSYRERVAQIRLNSDEGGLNLNMPPDIVQKIVDKGREAGELFWNPDENPDKFNLVHHQWVRFFVLMANLEENFEKMGINLKDPALGNLLTKPFASYSNYPYPPRDGDWLNEAIARLQTLQCLLTCWQEETPDLFHKDKPKPETVLRVTPEV